ncbi:MAG: hypothetical protein H0V17_16550 [Deltaproteobacteria bacterium]|nr:hypothetical protein [Deltaproteobacteria bacterium]
MTHLVELVSRDDVVLQRPEDVRFLVPVFHTTSACPGAVTAYVLRRIAYRAGAYAPGIQEQIFHELNTSREGGSIEKVQRWFGGRVSMLHQLGYRLQSRRVATPTAALLEWVRAGQGYRGAMLPTSFRRLHPSPGAAGKDVPDEFVNHAVGITIDRLDASTEESLVMIDPWPGVTGGAKDRDQVSPTIEIAHRDRGSHALVYFWVGWS